MTSTDVASGLRPWQFFLIASFIAATAAILVARETHPAALVLLSVVICSAGCAGFGAYRMLVPLVLGESARWRAQRSSGARTALDREKQLVLRSIKELEFDRAMGKVSDRDFDDMRARLRQRALGLMQQLDALGEETDEPSKTTSSSSGYRAAIEDDLARLLSDEEAAPLAAQTADATAAQSCQSCGTSNDGDARFCKSCGRAL
ncbi:MAG: hypothetical protein GEV06_27510 [Luteitalea sp.]|nr:hypothetical protein [Luteitalea sp.]